ncbi:MAG: PPOX class F420-dependent oxidoreductase [Rubrobacter sp.]|nr:PPOX class F420-dependent oxidoreductase [Rubrobacter sp.]
MSRRTTGHLHKTNAAGARANGAEALGSLALGALAAGAVAGGAVAIGALAIRRLAIKRGRIGSLSIGDLEVNRLRVRELVIDKQREPHPFDALEGHQFIRLTTFRRSGEEVSTPLWFEIWDGRLYATTPTDSGKMKRIRNNPRVVFSPGDARGRPRGESIEGLARQLSYGEAPEAARQAYWNKYGKQLTAARHFFRIFFGEDEIGKLTLEIRPANDSEQGDD